MLNNRLSIKLQKADSENLIKDLPLVLFIDYENYCKLV